VVFVFLLRFGPLFPFSFAGGVPLVGELVAAALAATGEGGSPALASRFNLAIRSSMALGVAPILYVVNFDMLQRDGTGVLVTREELGEFHSVIGFGRTLD
jgi:hypothetical protein